jgi:hypothetical protein
MAWCSVKNTGTTLLLPFTLNVVNHQIKEREIDRTFIMNGSDEKRIHSFSPKNLREDITSQIRLRKDYNIKMNLK